jgi:hypothetical protein
MKSKYNPVGRGHSRKTVVHTPSLVTGELAERERMVYLAHTSDSQEDVGIH